jgi:3'-5' exoribonuclease
MMSHKYETSTIPSKQPHLNAVYGLSRFCGFYFIAGLNARLTHNNAPYWEVIIQDAFETVTIYSDAIEPIINHLGPFSPVQVECVRRHRRGRYFFIADMMNPVIEIPPQLRHVGLIPYSAASNGYDLPKLLDRVCTIAFKPLQQFVHSTIVQRKVMLPFIRNPASLRYHHNVSGGLLSHSLAVSDLISQQFTQGTIEHDVAITAALLHDIGKTQTLTDNFGRTAIGGLTGHDALTLEICAEPLAKLSQEHPHVANQLRHAWTCGSPNARYGFTPQTRVARELQRADNFSAKL